MWWAHIDTVMNLLYHNTQGGGVLNGEGAKRTRLHGLIYPCYLCSCSKITGVSNSESQMHIIYQCAPWKVASRVDNLVVQALQFQNMCVWYNISSWAHINHCRLDERLPSGYFPGVLSSKSRRFGTLCRFHLQQVMKCEWGQAGNCPYLYGKRVVGERWSGPIGGEGRGRSSGSQEGVWSWWVGGSI
jgi:hypothetical protein